MSITAGNEVRAVLFSFSTQNLRLTSQQEGIGESEVVIPIEYEGDQMEITFNPDFIMDYIKVIEIDELPLFLKDENSSCLFQESSGEFYIVMPITSN